MTQGAAMHKVTITGWLRGVDDSDELLSGDVDVVAEKISDEIDNMDIDMDDPDNEDDELCNHFVLQIDEVKVDAEDTNA
jgi:hypothetical protein